MLTGGFLVILALLFVFVGLVPVALVLGLVGAVIMIYNLSDVVRDFIDRFRK